MRSRIAARRGRRLALAIGCGTIALVAGACVPQPATTQGRTIADLWVVFALAATVVGLIVWGLVTWSILRYRRRGEGLPPQTPGNIVAEIIWTVLPVITVVALFVLTFRATDAIEQPAVEPAVNVDVNAFTWQWSFRYRDAGVEIVGSPDAQPELVVPVGEPIRITLTSTDVDHAFYVPAFLFKRDAIPGHPSTFDFTVVAPGVYPGQCAEFCGLHHDTMRFTVRAVDRATFDAWLASRRAAVSSPASSPAISAPAASASAQP
jgi:cytochrome c oxidase subunit 2